MPASESFVKFEKVDKSYDGEVLVVKDLNIDIPKGEFLTMLGPSGSGKTTTLMMLAGFETPTNGEIYLDGDAISSIPPYKRGIGMVFQNYALFPHMTVNENLAFPLEVRKLNKSEIKEKVEKALSMVELQDFGNRMPLQLSGGQQQRVALARALVFEPRLVLMDEPLGALDKKLREQMQYEIKHIHGNIGITVVYVTHDQSEALTMSNRIAVFNDGKIQQISTPDVLYEKPENAFVAQFIGENNQLKGKVKSINGNMCVVTTGKGDEIKSLKVNINTVGDASTVSLRPERVEINSTDSNLENSFNAKVKELIYLGDHIRTRVEVCGNDQFIVKVPNSYKGADLKEGVSVKLSWRASDSRALDLA
ncbi:MAG: ABC transporter ATP-binding protein [Pelagibacteraceae bacterium]|jgi:putative spermidine/putrescine transport system ATP-binding protein|nr:ABC transporter ATP-binding protein [Pelagibacteraceae bacterium]MDP6710675.1 ABC transporter ATP-binding protein [Pelagibacteraceae bacterium]|tara:strand:+ start:56 stop:1147 length:1092 start_codon:yes stop_codon:yes gene_type:complete